MLINGVPGDKVDIHDRGLLYGDGVFRTFRLTQGRPEQWPLQYRKLSQDCTALGIICPEESLLAGEVHQLANAKPDGVAKIIITRGVARRGYAPLATAAPTRILTVSPSPDIPESFRTHGVTMRLCDLRLSQQPQLAGIKHLNRLENVLAAMEWSDPEIADGLLLDVAGNVVESTRSNIFLVRDGSLLTPDLSQCGVAGVQRERVMKWASVYGVACRVGHWSLEDVLAADEVFLVNSVIGLWPVRRLQQRNWLLHPLSRRIGEWLNHAAD